MRVRVSLLVAFMHAESLDDLYAWPPDGYPVEGHCWKVLTAKNGGRKVKADFGDFLASVLLVKLTINRCDLGPCVFYCFKRNVRMSTHVDDPMLCGPSAAVDKVLTEGSHVAPMRKGPKFNRNEPVLYRGREYLDIENGYNVRHPA